MTELTMSWGWVVQFYLRSLCLLFVILLLNEVNTATTQADENNEDGSYVAAQPNIVMILADDMGSRDLGFVDSDISTPHLDQLAMEGLQLRNHYAQSTCSPTRGQLLTGRYDIHMGIQHETLHICERSGLPLEFPTIANFLRDAGYSTHALGKWHLGYYKKEYTPPYRGFDTFYGNLAGYNEHFAYQACTGDPYPFDFCAFAWVNSSLDAQWDVLNNFDTHTITEKATEIIRESAKSETPMFMYLSFMTPHAPIEVPEVYVRKYKNIVNEQRAMYAGMVSVIDEGVKNISDALKEEGMWDNTVLIFMSDNGAETSASGSNWPLRGVKRTWWEGGIKSNAFVASPLLDTAQRGGLSYELMHVTDWLPTLADIAQVELDDDLGLDGYNQWSMIRKGSSSSRTEILHTIDELKILPIPRIYNHTFDVRVTAAIRVGDYKLLTGYPGDSGWYQVPGAKNYDNKSFGSEYDDTKNYNKTLWLYNIAKDPNELEDLSDVMPERVNAMLDRLAFYERGSIQATAGEIDYACNPFLRGGYWQPWVD